MAMRRSPGVTPARSAISAKRSIAACLSPSLGDAVMGLGGESRYAG